MKRLILAFALVATASTAFALTAVWDPITKWTDNTAIDPADKARIVVRIYRTTNPANPAALVATSAPGADNVALPAASRGTFYYYRADAIVDNVASDNSAWVGYVWLTGTLPPGGVIIIPR